MPVDPRAIYESYVAAHNEAVRLRGVAEEQAKIINRLRAALETARSTYDTLNAKYREAVDALQSAPAKAQTVPMMKTETGDTPVRWHETDPRDLTKSSSGEPAKTDFGFAYQGDNDDNPLAD